MVILCVALYCPVLRECFCCANGAAVCYWEEGLEYMRQKNTTHPPWALLNINTRQHSKNTQRDTPMYGRKEVRAVAWNAGVLQNPWLGRQRWNVPKLLRAAVTKFLVASAAGKIGYAAIVHWEHGSGGPRVPAIGPREIHRPVVASLIKEEP